MITLSLSCVHFLGKVGPLALISSIGLRKETVSNLALKTLFDGDIIDVKEGVAFVEEHYKRHLNCQSVTCSPIKS